MDEMTLEEKRAVAMASARLRLQQVGGNQSFTNDGTVGPTIARGGRAMQPDGSMNSALKNVVKGEGDWSRDRLGMLLSQEHTKNALDLFDREALFAKTKHDVVDNSYTAISSE